MMKRHKRDLLQADHGASLVEMALLLPLFLLIFFGAVDFGRACYMAIEIAGAARAGALYGSKSPSDAAGMKTVVQDAAPDVPTANLSVGTPTCSVECPDGTNFASGCTTKPACASGMSYVYLVNVTVTATYSPLFPWPKIPSSMSFSSSASMRSLGSA
jgi:Flp pilus assembly protein TadG